MKGQSYWFINFIHNNKRFHLLGSVLCLRSNCNIVPTVFALRLGRIRGRNETLAVESSARGSAQVGRCSLAGLQSLTILGAGWAQLGALKLVMEMQIRMAWFDAVSPKMMGGTRLLWKLLKLSQRLREWIVAHWHRAVSAMCVTAALWSKPPRYIRLSGFFFCKPDSGVMYFLSASYWGHPVVRGNERWMGGCAGTQ